MAARTKRDRWHVSDPVWDEMKRFLPPRKPHPLGCHRPRVPDRSAMNAILFVLRTGCQWAALDATGICSHASAHRRFMEWKRAGVFEQFWTHGLMACEELKGIDWGWLKLDSASVNFSPEPRPIQIAASDPAGVPQPEVLRPEVSHGPAPSFPANGSLMPAMEAAANSM